MMDATDYVLAKISEEACELAIEAAEIGKLIGKCLRFGLDSAHPNGGLTNIQALIARMGKVQAELQDVTASLLVLERLMDQRGTERAALPMANDQDDEQLLITSLDRFARYIKYSVRAKRISPMEAAALERAANFPTMKPHLDKRTHIRIDVTGNPQSGKTTVAALVGQFLQERWPDVPVRLSSTHASGHAFEPVPSGSPIDAHITRRLTVIDIVDHDGPLREVRPVADSTPDLPETPPSV